MKMTRTKKKEAMRLITTLEALGRLVDSNVPARVVLGGDLVLASLANQVVGPAFVKQPPRATVRKWLPAPPDKNKLQVWLAREAYALLEKAGSRIRASLAIDHYLDWGLKQVTPEFILFGGDAGPDKSILLVMQFKKGALVKLGEKLLPGVDNSRFFGEILPLLERAHSDVPGSPVYWAAPLPVVRDPALTHLGQDILTGRPSYLITASGKPAFLSRHGLALGLVGASILGYGLAVGLPYLKYQLAAQRFEAESPQLGADFQFSDDKLKLLQERKQFLSAAADRTLKVSGLESLLTAVAEAHYPLQDAVLRLKKDPTRGERSIYDFEITLEQPRNAALTAIEQGAPVVTRLSTLMHTPLHLAQSSSYQEIETVKGQFKRIYKIEGDFAHAPTK